MLQIAGSGDFVGELAGVAVEGHGVDAAEIGGAVNLGSGLLDGLDGGVFVVGDYSFDRAYMHDEELALLSKVQEMVKDKLSEKENALFSQIIKIYTKAA